MTFLVEQRDSFASPIYLEALEEGERLTIEALDGNQRLYAERMIETLIFQNPEGDHDKIRLYAIRQALEIVPTTREAAEQVAAMRVGPCYCYLGFYGLHGVASFLKIGMTGHPERRLYSFSTGNPLDCLWVFTTKIPSRTVARQAELAMLRSYADHKRRGEWVDVGRCEREGAEAIARELAVVVSEVTGQEANFSLLSYRDGRAAA